MVYSVTPLPSKTYKLKQSQYEDVPVLSTRALVLAPRVETTCHGSNTVLDYCIVSRSLSDFLKIEVAKVPWEPHVLAGVSYHVATGTTVRRIVEPLPLPVTGLSRGLAAAAPGHGQVAHGTKKVVRTWTGAGPGPGGPDPAPLSSPPAWERQVKFRKRHLGWGGDWEATN